MRILFMQLILLPLLLFDDLFKPNPVNSPYLQCLVQLALVDLPHLTWERGKLLKRVSRLYCMDFGFDVRWILHLLFFIVVYKVARGNFLAFQSGREAVGLAHGQVFKAFGGLRFKMIHKYLFLWFDTFLTCPDMLFWFLY